MIISYLIIMIYRILISLAPLKTALVCFNGSLGTYYLLHVVLLSQQELDLFT